MCIMSGSATFYSTIFHNEFISTRPNQSADRSKDIFSVFTAMCSQFLKLSFCETNQNCTPKDADWKTFAYFYWIPDGAGSDGQSAAAYHSTDSHEPVFPNWNVSRLKATNIFNSYVIIVGIHGRSAQLTMRKQRHVTAFFKAPSSSLTGSVSQCRDVTATTWRPEM